MKTELKEGQKLWLVQSNRRSNEGPKEVTVSKVGRKYFELQEYPYMGKFFIDTLAQAVDSHYGGQCYLELQMYLDEVDHTNLRSEIAKFFRNQYGRINLTLEQLRQINEIITP